MNRHHLKPASSLLQQAQARYRAEKKKLKRKQSLLKIKLAVTVVLPVIAVLAASKVIQTWVRIRVRDLFAKPADKPRQNSAKQPEPAAAPAEASPVQPEAAHMEPAEKTVFHLEPVRNSEISQ